MAFSDNFDSGASPLGTRTGWTRLSGASDQVTISSGRLSRSAGTDQLFYATGDDGATSQEVQGDFFVATSPMAAVLGSVSGGNFSGYVIRGQTGLTAARILRYNAGTPTVIATSGAIADCVGIKLTVSISGGNPVLTAFRGGVQIIAPTTDSSASKITSGQRGFFTTGTSFTSGFDNYSDNYTPPASVGFNLTERNAGFPMKPGRSFNHSLTYTGSPTSIEARWADTSGNAVSGLNWTTVVASPSGGAATFAFAAPSTPGDYKLQVRDGGLITTVTAANFVRVGKIVVQWSQSQGVRIFSQSDDLGTLTPTAGIKCTVIHTPDKTNATTPTFIDLASGFATLATGIAAEANQIWADNGGLPFTLVETGVVGTSIQQWIDNLPEGTMTWGCWDYATAVANAIENQVDVISFNQGTTDVGNHATYAAKMQQLADKFDLLYPGESPLFVVHPHLRSDDGNQTWNMRSTQYTKAISGGRWRLGAWQLDHVATADADPHQKAGATGNTRIGTRHGRALAKHLYNTSLDATGPVISSCKFTDGTRAVIEITFDRAIETPSAAATGLPGFVVSTNSGTDFTTLAAPGLTAAITASNKVQLTRTGGAVWAQGTTRIDYLRGVPYASDAATTNDYIASPSTAEASIETNYFSKVITDTTTFDGGRGMPMAPIMGTGQAVAEFDAVAAPARRGGGLRLRQGLGF